LCCTKAFSKLTFKNHESSELHREVHIYLINIRYSNYCNSIIISQKLKIAKMFTGNLDKCRISHDSCVKISAVDQAIVFGILYIGFFQKFIKKIITGSDKVLEIWSKTDDKKLWFCPICLETYKNPDLILAHLRGAKHLISFMVWCFKATINWYF